MNRAVISFALLFGSTVLVAQTASQNQTPIQTTTLSVAPPPSSCPVSLHARQTPGGDRMVVNGVVTKTTAQMLHLTVTDRDSKRVVAASVTVRGFSNKARFLPTGLSSQDSSDAAKTLDVIFSPATGKEVSADISVPGFTAVSAIDLNSVTYSDGSTWKLAAGSSCRSWIDGFMLVSSR
ncbi:MAG TPA: hypothetical protein VGG56_16215 [Terracidiphilus sp.]|jgi:hypothetical protein